MNKFLMILCSIFLLTGCADKTIESSISEIIPESTTALQTTTPTEPETEEVTEITRSNVYEKQTYHEVLENIYYNCKFPQYDEPFENYDLDISNNEFAVYDIDNDGRDELIFMFNDTYTAGMMGMIYDHNSDGNIFEEFIEFPSLRFYDNGVIEANISHNQGPSGDFWPYTLYKYDNETDSYIEIASVWSLGRDIIERQKEEAEKAGYEPYWEYPYEADTSNSGIVYIIILSDDEYSSESHYVDVTEYNAWHEQYVGDAKLLELPFMKLTEENIENVSQ